MSPSSSARHEPSAPGSLHARLDAEITQALKAGEKVRLGTLRLLSAAAKNREVELRRRLTDEEFLEVAGREAKRRREAIEVYEGAGRADRAASEREELQVLETYLPTALNDEEVDALVGAAVTATGATGLGDVGRVMGFVMARARGRVDGKAVQARVRQHLGKGESEPPLTPQPASASRAFGTVSAARTPYQACTIRPSSSIRNDDRTMPS